MVLLKVNAIGVTVLELECDGPWAIHVDRVSLRIKAQKTVEVEPWQVEVFRHRRCIQRIEAPSNALEEPGIDFRTTAFPQLLQFLVPELSDHN